MKRYYRLLTIILTLAIAISLTVPALASTGTSKVTANYMGISIVVDGKTVIPSDGAGHNIEPFAISGSTYLPVRAVANALGLDVDWDVATKTVILKTGGTPDLGSGTAPKTTGSKEVTISTMDIKITLDGTLVTPLDGAGKPVEPFALNGTTYLPVRAVANALGVEIIWDATTKTVSIGSVEKNEENEEADEYRLKTVVSTSSFIPGSIQTADLSYDSAGKLVAMKNTITRHGTVEEIKNYTVTTDSAGRITQSIDEDGNYERMQYDANGNVVRYEVGDGKDSVVAEQTFNKDNTLATRTTYQNGVKCIVLSMEYSQSRCSRINCVNYVDNPAGDTATIDLAYSFDSQQRPSRVSMKAREGGVEENGAFVYTYDVLYDDYGKAIGNSVRLEVIGYSEGTAVTSAVVSYSYDKNGNLQESVDAYGQTTKYTYEAIPQSASCKRSPIEPITDVAAALINALSGTVVPD